MEPRPYRCETFSGRAQRPAPTERGVCGGVYGSPRPTESARYLEPYTTGLFFDTHKKAKET